MNEQLRPNLNFKNTVYNQGRTADQKRSALCIITNLPSNVHPEVASKHKSKIPVRITQAKRTPLVGDITDVPDCAEPMEAEGSDIRNVLPRAVADVEEGATDPIRYNEYASDVYEHLKTLEEEFPIREHFLKVQNEVMPKHRAILVDWIHEMHVKLELPLEAFYRSVALVDTFMQAVNVSKDRLQLLGVSALFVASKYEASYCPSVKDFAYMTSYACDKYLIARMELDILRTTDFRLGRPVSITFLRRLSQVSGADKTLHTLAKYLLELSSHSYKLAHVPPSLMAVAASVLAAKLLNRPHWSASLQSYAGYDYHRVLPVVKLLAEVVFRLSKSTLRSVRDKYSSRSNREISKLPVLAFVDTVCF